MTLQEARKALGKTGEKMSDTEIEKLVVSMGYLIDGWLDTYERKVFKGKTIKELTSDK